MLLDDETLRDGLQSPSVRCPTIEEKLRDPAPHRSRSASTRPTSACPAPARTSSATSSGWRARSSTQRLNVQANCAARTVDRRHQADRRDLAARRASRSSAARSSGRARSGSTPKAGRSTSCCKLTEEAITFAVGEGLPVMYVTEDTTRADPETLRAALLDGDSRRRDAGLHRRHRRPRDAGRRGRGRPVRRRRSSRSAAAASGSTGTAIAIATSRSSTRWRRSRPARRGCTARRSASASASATRRWTCCS